MTQIGFPYKIGRTGATDRPDDARHLRGLIEQVLFTAPGERVNRPTFGSGLLNLVFSPGSNELAAATQFLVHGALQQNLGDRIMVQSVQAQFVEGTLTVEVKYALKSTGETRNETFERKAG